jgi:two-component system chemotaxis sensor kinase CheA
LGDEERNREASDSKADMKEDLQRQLIDELVVESLEGLDAFDHDILELERGDRSPETWNNAFRIIHTIKGSSGCVGFSKVESVAHVGESLLAVLRDGGLAPDSRTFSSLLRYSDALREMMRSIGHDGSEGLEDHSQLVRDIQALHAGITGVAGEKESFGFFGDAPTPDAPTMDAAPMDESELVPAQSPDTVEPVYVSKVSLNPRPEDSPVSRVSPTDTAIRVDVSQIDRLMNLVGELVLARNRIVQSTGHQADPGHLAAIQRINLITSELQESVMKTRMQPIGNIWSKVPRIIRDLCHELGKDVALVMEGNETELDRTIIEAIKDPMTHIIRNAIDHGIEQPEQRLTGGKAAQGRLVLRAFHEGGQVNIEISDDGKGIDAERVLQKALQRGLVTPEQGVRMSQREMLALIFLPGLSTAEKVTNVSGRGVGMDVVKTNIEKIGGNVDLQSERGKGTTIRIRIPLTLAIIPALVVACGGDRYAIPAASLVELVRIEGDQVQKAVEHIHEAPVYRLRGNLLPLVYLAKELELTALRRPDEAMFLIVLQAEGRQFGLVVDGINDTEEIVVKPLGKEMKGLSVYAGATIMGDGKVALILDVLGLARRALLLEENGRQALKDSRGAADRGSETQNEVSSLLVARVGRNRIAVPLSCIARLEEIAATKIEHAGKLEVVQYRGRIMTVVRLASVLGIESEQAAAEAGDPERLLSMVVCALETNHLGVIVDSIEDIVEERIHIEIREGQRGILGSAVVRQRVTDLLDVKELARAAA